MSVNVSRQSPHRPAPLLRALGAASLLAVSRIAGAQAATAPAAAPAAAVSLARAECGTNAPPSPQPIAYVVTVKYLR